MKTYYIVLRGCHDDTQFSMELTEEEYAVIGRVAFESLKASKSSCHPFMDISPEPFAEEIK